MTLGVDAEFWADTEDTITIGAGTGSRKAKAPGVRLRAVSSYVGRHVAKGSTRHKKTPSWSHSTFRRGCQQTRRLGIDPHGALRSREASPSQRSSGKGCCDV
jgi:hypothetical protein